jgi:formamidopyrimidine-DNA glycosylase
MWSDTSGLRGSRTPGPELGIHLGMSGKIVIVGRDGQEVEGGDYWARGRPPGDHRFARFSLRFADGGALILVDPRRLGRVRLDPPVDRLGPDALEVTLPQLRRAVSSSKAPVKARIMDQQVIAGIGNLLADQMLWLAGIPPSLPADELTGEQVNRLHRALRRTLTAAIKGGGVHMLSVVPLRKAGALCPRDGAPMQRSTVGGRTTWWCSAEQGRVPRS